MRCSLNIVNLCSYVPQSLYGLEDSYTTVQLYGSPLKASTPPFLPLPLPEMLKLSTVLLQPVRSERLQGSSSTCPCRHFNRLPFLSSRVILCVWTSLSLCGMSISQTGILYFRLRFMRVLPSTYSLTFSLTHFPSFYVNLVAQIPHLFLQLTVVSATEWKVESYQLSLSPNRTSFGLHTAKAPYVHSCFLYLTSLDFVHCHSPCHWIQSLPDDILFSEHPLMACSLHRMIGENDQFTDVGLYFKIQSLAFMT